ncbi:MFS general substrate transporter [Karstenula rhodostoma CBS 690.94]|uniref:MFS general substrate transporter n=1 Tax=Karstenula rhodostoma CBS 690.94 TaxID=1392251 RepID=A0A9P4PTF4_9PLEO|nr:MFS general substrate transporter [Karstenula rhodostoma CBS 690.94]
MASQEGVPLSSIPTGTVVHPSPPVDVENAIDSGDATLKRLFRRYGATWDGPNDPHNPYNWNYPRRLRIAAVVSLGQFLAYMSASMIAPALVDIENELHIDATTSQVVMLITFLGFGIGEFAFAVLAEIFGRRPAWIVGNTWFILWNAIAPSGNSTELLIFARLMAGIGASVNIVLAFPVMQDLFHEEHRGLSIAIVSCLTYTGPALGPILGGIAMRYLRWQWIFWILSIINTGVVIIGYFLLEETYTPSLLRHKRAAQASTTSSTSPLWKPWQSMKAAQEEASLTECLFRPFQLYTTRPIIYVITGLLALDMGVYCVMLSSLAKLWTERYHTSKFTSSLHYIAVAIGATINGQCGSWLMDRIYSVLKRRNKGVGQPEFRVPYLVPGLVLMPAGLVWYGWAAHHVLSWAMVDFGVGIFTLGSFTTAQAVNSYQLDEFKEYSASALAATFLLQNVLGFLMPIWAPKMYEVLGYGWGNSLVALVVVVVGLPMAAVLWFWGAKIRAMGRKEDELENE